MTASMLNNPSGVIGFMLLSERIAEAIEGSKKTRAEISRACGVTNAAVTHWLNGDTANLGPSRSGPSDVPAKQTGRTPRNR